MEVVRRLVGTTDYALTRRVEPEAIGNKRGFAAGEALQSLVVAQAVGVERSVAEEVEGRAMKFVGAGLGDHVDRAAGGPPELGREAVGVDLKLLHRVLAELIGGSARSCAAQRLAEEQIIVVHAVNLDAVERTFLPAE